MAHDVFISHSVKNKTTADAVCAMLESEGIRCWIAPRDVMPGMEWGECIIEAIEQARIMVLVFTADANASPQIRREVERAVNHGVAILPLRVEDVLPGKALEYFIGNVHWLDAITPPIEAHLKNLAGTVKMLLARMPAQEAAAQARPAEAMAAEAPESQSVQRKAPSPPQPGEASAWDADDTELYAMAAAPPAEPAHRSRRVSVWVWGGGLALALLSVLIFVGVRLASHPAPTNPAPRTSGTPSGGGAPAGTATAKTEQPSEGPAASTTATPQALGRQANDLINQKRYAQARPLAEQACSGGSPVGCRDLAWLYRNGFGVPQDDTRSSDLYRKACDGGDLEGCEYLGMNYGAGYGVAQDPAMEVSLFRKVCDGGVMDGCDYLGQLYWEGAGIAEDDAQAAFYFRKACKGGFQEACDRLKELQK